MKRSAWLLGLIALSCARRGGPVGLQDSAGDEPAKRRAGEALLIGNTQRLGTKTCKTWKDEAWSDVHWRAGLVRLEGNTSGVARFAGKPLLLLGEVAKRGAPELPQESETCPPVQSSDWKPMPHGERRELGRLAPGARAQVAVPAFAAGAPPQSGNLHRPISIQVHGTAPDVYFDLDLRLSALGIELSCPKG